MAARLYPKEDLGVATAIISSMTLIVLLSRLGLDLSIMRFFPQKKNCGILSTSAMITTLFAVIIALIFVEGCDIWAPGLNILKSEYLWIYLLFILTDSIVAITGNAFVAMRQAKFYLLQNIIMGLRILLLIPLASLGMMGIFSSFGLPFLLTAIVTVFILRRDGIALISTIDTAFLKESLNYSLGNYISSVLMAAPNLIFPIMILNILGANETAHYFIAFSIGSMLFMIPSAISTSLLVECSHGEALKDSIIKSLKESFVILIPAVILIYLLGGWLLGIIGKDYVEGMELLRVFVISSPLVAINYIYLSMKRIQRNVMVIVLLNGMIFSLLMILSYILLKQFGLMGIGYAWFVAYSVGAGYCFIDIFRSSNFGIAEVQRSVL